MLRILTIVLAAVAADDAAPQDATAPNNPSPFAGPFEAPPAPLVGDPLEAPPQPEYGVAMSETQRWMLEAINAYRAKYGLGALLPDTYLMNSAQQHSYWMTSGGGMVHQFGPYMENIAYGDWNVGAVMYRWSVSPTHNPTMLHPSATHFGGGFSSAGGVPYWTQRFRVGAYTAATAPATTYQPTTTYNNNYRRRWRPFRRLFRRR